jgi:hypothetical protein
MVSGVSVAGRRFTSVTRKAIEKESTSAARAAG